MFLSRPARALAWPVSAALTIALTLGAASPAAAAQSPEPEPPSQSAFTGLLSLSSAIGLIGRPEPYAKPDGGCTRPDPAGVGCITPRTEWALKQIGEAFGGIRGDVIKWVGCWDEHAWNPKSDHPLGKGCDLYVSPARKFAGEGAQQTGWLIAWWLRVNRESLGVKYVIWQGKIWSARRAGEGWRPYDGGGIYNVKDPVGGHYDHIHVSMIA